MPIVLDGTNGITTPDVESTGPIIATTGAFSGNVTANGLPTELRPLVLGAAQVATSGTSIDFTGIPSWAKRVTVLVADLSTNGTSPIIIQIGDSGGFETTGYSGSGVTVGTSTVAGNQYGGSGYLLVNASIANYQSNGAYQLANLSGNTWVAWGSSGLGNTPGAMFTGGSKTLSATLDRIRITTVNGTDTFDGGSINIMYE